MYELQGAAISRKHLEVIIMQMTSRVRITIPGDSRFSQGDLIELSALRDALKTVNPEAKLIVYVKKGDTAYDNLECDQKNVIDETINHLKTQKA